MPAPNASSTPSPGTTTTPANIMELASPTPHPADENEADTADPTVQAAITTAVPSPSAIAIVTHRRCQASMAPTPVVLNMAAIKLARNISALGASTLRVTATSRSVHRLKTTCAKRRPPSSAGSSPVLPTTDSPFRSFNGTSFASATSHTQIKSICPEVAKLVRPLSCGSRPVGGPRRRSSDANPPLSLAYAFVGEPELSAPWEAS